jgi:hypothetical protein
MKLQFYVRGPFEEEANWFKDALNVSGYVADDDAIVVNPFSKLSNEEKACVVRNEAIRLLMRCLNLKPCLQVTTNQKRYFAGTEYEFDEQAMRETIIGRIASGDPSAQDATPEQIGYAMALLDLFKSVVELKSDEESNSDLLRRAVDIRVSPRSQTDI